MQQLSPMWRLFPMHGRVGVALVLLGEALILARVRPISDFYFPFVWLGYILVLDGALARLTGRSLLTRARPVFLALFPISAVFWWIFEYLNESVHNWIYVGGTAYKGLAFVAMASVDFSTVLPAVVATALVLSYVWPLRHPTRYARVPGPILLLSAAGGVACLVLPIVLPRYAFGLVWGSLFLLLDPLNYRLGRPSMLAAVAARSWRLPLSFAFAALMCGFFWEAWNFWAMPKWMYDIPYVGFWHIFEMPLLGWTGYLPFGLELFAMTNFVLPLLRLGTLDLHTLDEESDEEMEERRVS